MLFVKSSDHLPLISLESLSHKRAERAIRGYETILRHFERRKPEIRDLTQIARTEKAARLQIAQAIAVTRLEKKRAIELVRLSCHLIIGFLVPAMLVKKAQKVS
jgi:hypothetical protein